MLDGDTIPLDHYVLFPPYLAADDAETLDGIVRNDPEEIERAYATFNSDLNFTGGVLGWSTKWLKDGSGLMAHK